MISKNIFRIGWTFSEEYAYAEEEAEAQEIYQNRERLLRELLAELETALQKYTK